MEAICALAVRKSQAVVFADLTGAAPHRLTSEAVAAARAKNLQFYAGVPLRMPDKVNIGTLCVIDHQPRTFSDAETQALEKISEVVALTLVARHYCLTAGLGEHHWQTLQAELVEQIEALGVLVRYVTKHSGAQIPVSSLVLASVLRRLQDLYDTLKEYLDSKA